MGHEETMKVLCDLEERAVKDIKELLKKPDISPTEWKTASEGPVDVIKDIITIGAMIDYKPEDEGYFERMYRRPEFMDNDMAYAGGRMRGSNGRYMNDGTQHRTPSYNNTSYHGEMGNLVTNLRNQMNNANSEGERRMYQRFIEEAEQGRW